MPRLNELADVLFPVELQPVFAGVNGSAGNRSLAIPDKKAIVDPKGSRVLGVVSREYRLVTNREALDWGYQCCRAVFPETKQTEWEVKATDAPASGGHCFIDIVHNSSALDFSVVPARDRPDVFGPFVRITNSYNGLRALTFDIGFFRKVCKNGMILPDTIIKFKFTHSRRQIGQTVNFDIAHDRLAGLKTSFAAYVGALHACPVQADEVEPLVRAVLGINKPDQLEADTHEGADWEALAGYIAELGNKYAAELGRNAYAALNVITDLASHPPPSRHLRRERHTLQKRAGTWLSDFTKRCSDPRFSFQAYLTQIAGGAQTIADLAPVSVQALQAGYRGGYPAPANMVVRATL